MAAHIAMCMSLAVCQAARTHLPPSSSVRRRTVS
jgi:hypothetical protein